MRTIQVDIELSPLVQRKFSLLAPTSLDGATQNGDEQQHDELHKTILRTEYRATTNRMLRVAVNGFMESLGVVLQVMEELDTDVLSAAT
jgi:EKC/KEOPS complex subunit PCC1/LAGE3